MHHHSASIAIIGAGLAGLWLAYKLKSSYPSLEIIIIGPPDERCQHVSGWQLKSLTAADPFIEKSTIATFDEWRIRISGGEEVFHKADCFIYKTIDANRLKQNLRQYLSTQEGVFFKEVKALDYRCEDAVWYVRTEYGDISADRVYSSVSHQELSSVRQQFIGIKIREALSNEMFLMDFDIPQNSSAPRFVYALPTDTGYLMELTTFSEQDDPMSDALQVLQQWSIARLGRSFDEDDILEVEQGVIPMDSDYVVQDDVSYLGVAGGAARPATGYAFRQILLQTEFLVSAFNVDEAKSYRHFTRLTTWMDRVFIRVLQNQPYIAEEVFYGIASSLSGDQFSAFLMDESSLKEKLKVILSSPKLPFLKAAFI